MDSKLSIWPRNALSSLNEWDIWTIQFLAIRSLTPWMMVSYRCQGSKQQLLKSCYKRQGYTHTNFTKQRKIKHKATELNTYLNKTQRTGTPPKQNKGSLNETVNSSIVLRWHRQCLQRPPWREKQHPLPQITPRLDLSNTDKYTIEKNA